MVRRNKTPDQLERAALLARRRRSRRYLGVLSDADHVPVGPTREMLLRALLRDVPAGLIGAAAGTDERTIARIFRPGRTYMTAGLAARLQRGVDEAEQQMAQRVSPNRILAEPYRVMLRRLGAAGWPLRTLCESWGAPENATRDRAKYITPGDALLIEQMYDKIGYELGPSMQTARYWRGRGYYVPAAECFEDMLPLPPTQHEVRARARRARRKRERRRLAA